MAWFLTESHRGYCMHFASAAVLLLRSMGVPARYVSGFVADVPASGRVNVPDSAAHAWVEVYIDGYGWEPVEVTPSTPGALPARAARRSPRPPPPHAHAPRPAAPPTPPRLHPPPTPSAALPNEGPEAPSPPASGPPGRPSAGAGPPLRRFWARRRRERRFQDENPNRAAIAAYLYLQRLTRWGAGAARPGRGAGPKGQIQPPHPHRRGAGRGAPRRPRRGRGGGQVPPLVEAVRLPLSAGAVLRPRSA